MCNGHGRSLASAVQDKVGSLDVYSDKQLHDAQCQDNTLSHALLYVDCGCRPNRHERAREIAEVLRLKHWDKFVSHSGILYTSKVRQHQFVVPDSLKFMGVHECAGHQGGSI